MSGSWSRLWGRASNCLTPFHQQPLILPEQVVALFGNEFHAEDGGLGAFLFQRADLDQGSLQGFFRFGLAGGQRVIHLDQPGDIFPCVAQQRLGLG